LSNATSASTTTEFVAPKIQQRIYRTPFQNKLITFRRK
jgi:hypothetical protein